MTRRLPPAVRVGAHFAVIGLACIGTAALSAAAVFSCVVRLLDNDPGI
jgi:hypothetical protein